jgi:hypothetical protein
MSQSHSKTSRQGFGTLSPAMTDWHDLLTSSPLAKGTKMGDTVVSGARRLGNATTIVEEFLAAGLPLSLALAAVTNANAESRLNDAAVGDFADGEYHSKGLFQIQDLKGRRKFSGDRTDPVYATRWIIEETRAHEDDTHQKEYTTDAQVYAESIRSALNRGASTSELAGLFAFHVERPAQLEVKRQEREEMARKLFPTVADLPGPEVDKLGGVTAAQPEGPSFLSSVSSAIWQPVEAASSFFFPSGSGAATFRIADGGNYKLEDASGKLYGAGEVPEGAYAVLYDGRPLKTAKGTPIKLNVLAGSTYEANKYTIRSV